MSTTKFISLSNLTEFLSKLNDNFATKAAATTSADGLMSASDKTKLNGIASGATAVNESTVTGWGFTKNQGTITGITMNGASKGTSGVVDLGTVITSHQDISGKQDKITAITAATTQAVYPIKIDTQGHITAYGSAQTIPAAVRVKGNSETSYRTGDVNLTAANIGAASSSHTHGNVQNGGTLQTNDVAIASGDKLVITDSSDSNKIARTSLAFDGSTTTQFLSKKGTWAEASIEGGVYYGDTTASQDVVPINADQLQGHAANYFQQALVSGTNIKTVNGGSLLGSGNIDVIGYSGIDKDNVLRSSGSADYTATQDAWIVFTGGNEGYIDNLVVYHGSDSSYTRGIAPIKKGQVAKRGGGTTFAVYGLKS